jgi:hypothetical protein
LHIQGDQRDKDFDFDYGLELKKLWARNVRSLNSKVICVECSSRVTAIGIDEIIKQIFLNRVKHGSSLFEALVSGDIDK